MYLYVLVSRKIRDEEKLIIKVSLNSFEKKMLYSFSSRNVLNLFFSKTLTLSPDGVASGFIPNTLRYSVIFPKLTGNICLNVNWKKAVFTFLYRKTYWIETRFL